VRCLHKSLHKYAAGAFKVWGVVYVCVCACMHACTLVCMGVFLLVVVGGGYYCGDGREVCLGHNIWCVGLCSEGQH